MIDLADIFVELGISHYLNDFVEQGFDTWDTILDITESDFDALGVKLGHRRKLQRKIAETRGLSSDRALASPSRTTPSDDRQSDEKRVSGTKTDAKHASSGTNGAKRKYRRHPKPDENAPERPPSAYVIFSNKMREDFKGRNLSFTEIAKLVGENWQSLSPGEKEPYEQQALSAKERYNNELAEYKKTSEYKEYSKYLVEFKTRQSNQQQVTDLDVAKRPKLENHASTASSGTTSSGASLHGLDTPSSRTRVESTSSNQNHWTTPNGHTSPQSALTVSNASKDHGSPTSSSTVLPGYRDSIFGGNAQVAWREEPRDTNFGGNTQPFFLKESLREEVPSPPRQFPRTTAAEDKRSSYTKSPLVDSLNPTGSSQHAHRTGQGRPPTLTSESTTRSSGSSASTSSTAFYTPRTPMEASFDRALPLPSLYPQKSSSNFEKQLPPLRPPSLSPQSTAPGFQQSPNGIHAILDFPTSMAPMRGYTATVSHNGVDNNDPRVREFGSSEDNILDPVSALLRAGEIVNRRGEAPR